MALFWSTYTHMHDRLDKSHSALAEARLKILPTSLFANTCCIFSLQRIFTRLVVSVSLVLPVNYYNPSTNVHESHVFCPLCQSVILFTGDPSTGPRPLPRARPLYRALAPWTCSNFFFTMQIILLESGQLAFED